MSPSSVSRKEAQTVQIMKRQFSGLLVLIVVSVVMVQAQAPAAKFNGRWRVKFTMAGLEKNVIFEVKEKGSGSFKLLDTGPNDKPVAELAPGVWSQLTNDRVSFSGETELHNVFRRSALLQSKSFR